MQKLYSIIIAIVVSQAISLIASSESVYGQSPKLLTGQIESQMRQRGWVDSEMVVENLHILKKKPEFQELQKQADILWPRAVNDIQAIAPSAMAKTILFEAFQSLPPESYLNFLDGAVSMTENGKIDKRLLNWALFPQEKGLRGILVNNYDNPKVAGIVNRAKVLFSNDPGKVKFFDEILSGKVKANDESLKADGAFGNKPTPKNAGEGETKGAHAISRLPVGGNTPSSTPQASPTNVERSAPKEAPSNLVWLYSLAVIILGGIGFVFYRGCNR